MSGSDDMQNPFTPSFGQMPPFFAGRERILRDLEHAFDCSNRSPELTTLLLGARGTGKTALLAKVCDEARAHGWIAVNTVASSGMLDDVLIQATRKARHLVDDRGRDKRLTGVGVGQIVNLAWEDAGEEASNWRSSIEDLLDKLEAQGSGLLIAVDEVDPTVEEMIQLARVYQMLVMDDRRVSLMMAGLPFNIE